MAYEFIAQGAGNANVFKNLLAGREAGLESKSKALSNQMNEYALGRQKTKDEREDKSYNEIEDAKALYPIISRAAEAKTPQEQRQILATTSQLLSDRLDDEDRVALQSIMDMDDDSLGYGVSAMNKRIQEILQKSSPPDMSAVQSTMILDNGNIGTVRRDGSVVDTGTKARGYASRPIETDAGVFSFDPGKGQVAEQPIVTQDQLVRGAASKAGAVAGAQESAKASVEKQTAKPAATTRLSAAQDKVKLVSEMIDQAISQAGLFTTGFIGGQIAKIPGTPAYDLNKTLDTIKANIGFDKLQEMRDSSPTGGALGQVTERENTLLQAVWGALDQSQSEKQFKDNLARVKRQVKQSWDRVAAAYEQTYGKPMPEDALSGGAAPAAPGAGAGGGWSIQEVK